ncbi:VanW family protein [Candidatus Daviesbacteria bacterium]|nr:VanW family protein [Candidatus Daviesbacteria bacterium]
MFFFNNFIAVATISILSLGLPYSKPGDSFVILAQHSISLSNRQPDKFVNNVFKDNILLNLNYMDDVITNRSQIDWAQIEKNSQFSFTLKPGEAFAFHDDVLDKYRGKVVKTTNAHFNFSDGFKSDGYLAGDGVCHLASLIYWAAKDAGLETQSLVNHDFAAIPEIPREYGVSIFSMPGDQLRSAQQNLYITNNRQKDVSFNFEYRDDKLKLSVAEAN